MKKIHSEMLNVIYSQGEKGADIKQISAILKLSKKQKDKALEALNELKSKGTLAKSEKKRYFLRSFKNYFEGTITGVSDRFGFVSRGEGEDDFFVPGHDLHGAIVGDKVLAYISERKSEGNRSDVAKIISIISTDEKIMSGTIVRQGMRLMVMPDEFGEHPLTIIKSGRKLFSTNDKVAFSIFKRGESHADHQVQILDVFGNSDTAKACVNAYLAVQEIPVEFSEEAVLLAEKINSDGIDKKQLGKRLDLRELNVFTIDSADTKDIDDAISVEKDGDIYRLGVHIADVSHYVRRDGVIETEAFKRGTSTYFADSVIPMLPQALSNGICSLNPRTVRLAFSCLMEVDSKGNLLSYDFKKSIIRSRLKGVYDEINRIYQGNATKTILKKYEKVNDSLILARELADILKTAKIKRGAPEITSDETKLTLNDDGVCVGVGMRESGISEGIIEEFMLMANKSAASLAMKNIIPFVYRIHDKPPVDKLADLKRVLDTLNVDTVGLCEEAEPKVLAEILNKNREHERFSVINRLVLRSMSKARYSEMPVGHYGLVLKEYAHFTSPIRRYSDLAIHRILSDFVKGNSTEKIVKKYTVYSKDSAKKATITELSAVKCERECTKFYMAEYMSSHIGEEFDGIVSGVTNSGIFVQLENTIEGFVAVQNLPSGNYECIDAIALKSEQNGRAFTIGDAIKVKCVKADVSAGKIDFTVPEFEGETNADKTNAGQVLNHQKSRPKTAVSHSGRASFQTNSPKNGRPQKPSHRGSKRGRSVNKQNKHRRSPKQ